MSFCRLTNFFVLFFVFNCRLCAYVIINKRCFESIMCLELIPTLIIMMIMITINYNTDIVGVHDRHLIGHGVC